MKKKHFQCTRCHAVAICPMRAVLPTHATTGELGKCSRCNHDQFILTFIDTPIQTQLYQKPEVTLETR